eukprot:TRINITY_DN11842_c0_g1_i2.p1 TRINITY_DN11842_c0_g1~~TRINITY_DN11842_c0_g1_i2.p1  ORF type:complete len:294 (-),score=30.92 TRINITY_DN11842_c0_g1_i2:60-941(-)
MPRTTCEWKGGPIEGLLHRVLVITEARHDEKKWNCSRPLLIILDKFITCYHVTYRLGVYTNEGRGGSRDRSVAHGLWKQALDLMIAGNINEPTALFDRAIMLEKGFPDRDPRTALLYLMESAEAGFPKALFNVGMMYKRGDQVPLDAKKAVMYLEQAASGGDRQAMIVLGRMYAHGSGVPRDYNRAAHHYEEAYRVCADSLRERKIYKIYTRGKYFPPNLRKTFLYSRYNKEFRKQVWDPLFEDDTWTKIRLMKRSQMEETSLFSFLLPEIVTILGEILVYIYFHRKATLTLG